MKILNGIFFQDKEEKERLLVSKQAAAEESDKDGANSGGEEIIELQEMRVSPIPSLRNRHKQKYYKDPSGKQMDYLVFFLFLFNSIELLILKLEHKINFLYAKCTSCYFQGQIKVSLQAFECTETIHFQSEEGHITILGTDGNEIFGNF